NNLAVVPEPSTIVLGVVGVLGLAIARRRAAK
ncbi:MAG: PEP-CTERM sorting domain-containing protein, partial [Kiritimatiellae bacterium]|nr:PEP-CTERM sorting domain-containing protein [Kiritimatiellia bacterium]